jgi:hypothetical protein
MSGKLGVPTAGGEFDNPPRRSATKAAPAPRKDAPEDEDSPDVRLIIEEAEDPERQVYTLVDRRTGEVVGRFKRDEMLRRAEAGLYAAGDGISVKA